MRSDLGMGSDLLTGVLATVLAVLLLEFGGPLAKAIAVTAGVGGLVLIAVSLCLSLNDRTHKRSGRRRFG